MSHGPLGTWHAQHSIEMEMKHPYKNRVVGLQIQLEICVTPPVPTVAVMKLQEQMQAQALPSAMHKRIGPTVTVDAQLQKAKCPTLPRLLSGCGGASETSPHLTSQLMRFLFRHSFLLQGVETVKVTHIVCLILSATQL